LNKRRNKNNNGERKSKQGRSSADSGGRRGGMTGARLVLIAIGGGIAALLAVAMFLSGGFTKLSGTGEQRAALVTEVLAPSTAGAMPLKSAIAEVSAGAPKVTIVEFGDYQCNSCGRFHKESKDLVVSNLVNTGKASFMFKDYTINDRVYLPRDGSTLAAEAAYCAGDQGKFWPYHDELYNKQEKEGVEWISLPLLKSIASNVGISDMDQFSQCLESHQYKNTVDDNHDLAVKLGLNATPTFLVIAEGKDPQVIVGAHPYSTFERVVNEMSQG